MSVNGERRAEASMPSDALRGPPDQDPDEAGLTTAACGCGWFTVGTERAVESACVDHRLDACAAALLRASGSG